MATRCALSLPAAADVAELDAPPPPLLPCGFGDQSYGEELPDPLRSIRLIDDIDGMLALIASVFAKDVEPFLD